MVCIRPLAIKNKATGFTQFVPCGHCMPCRINKTQEWVIRLELEKMTTQQSAFVTLTYDDDHLPYDRGLHKKHLQKFFKRLRKAGLVFRYYAVGEYGEKELKYYCEDDQELIDNGGLKPHGRPHYHLLFFGVNFRDDGDFETLVKSWKNCSSDYWYIHRNKLVGNLDSGSIRYTCDYMQKKLYGLNSHFEYWRILAPFSLCSQRLGLDGFTKYLDTYKKNGYIVYNGHKCPIPRYFREKFDIEISFDIDENNIYRKICLQLGFITREDLPRYDALCKKNRTNEYFHLCMQQRADHLQEIDKLIKRRNFMYSGEKF